MRPVNSLGVVGIRVVAALPTSRPLRVLDVGCGNGRFGVYLHERGLSPLHYTGTDNSRSLLELARNALTDMEQVNLIEADLLSDPLPDGLFDLVVLFGVIHHIPAAAQRMALMRDLAEGVAPGGLLAFAAWRFYDNPRFQERTLAWPPDLDREPGDYLLDWRRGYGRTALLSPRR
jgi:tRNA (uracil-5-)-methyltransferase TRM9